MSGRLSGSGIVLIIATALCSGIGITTLKAGLAADPIRLGLFGAGAVIYGAGIHGGIALIGKYSLSIAYPIVEGSSLTVVAVISATSLAEPMKTLKLAGTAPFAKVTLVKDDEEIHVITPNQKEVELTWTDPKPVAGQRSYYYFRGEQTNGELVWVSPMWITYAPAK